MIFILVYSSFKEKRRQLKAILKFETCQIFKIWQVLGNLKEKKSQ